MLNLLKEHVLGISNEESIREVFKKSGLLSSMTNILVVALALFHIITSYVGQLEAFRHRATHLLVIIALIFLSSIEKKMNNSSSMPRKKLSISLDVILLVMTLASLAYTFYNSPMLPLRAGEPNVYDMIIGGFTILLTIEAARRHVGIGIVVVCVFFLFYVYAGPIFPGFLRHAPFTLGEIINIQYLDLEGIWGSPLGAAASFVIVFLIFAGLMVQTGILNVFMEFAMKLVGTSIGGPAKVAVFSSSLIGMVNGTAAGNALLTGQVSIPLMKKMGYTAPFAAAVEATASTGGQVMPPIMGSAAFIIAMFLGIPYRDVCKAALAPALLWFFSLFAIVHLEALKLNLRQMTSAEMTLLPTWRELCKKAYLAFPMLLLIVIMISGYSEIRAGFWGIISLFFISFFRKETRLTIKSLVSGLKAGIQMAFSVTTACACAGIIVGCVMQSGLGYTLSASLIKVANGNIAFLLPLVMLAAIILGTGMMTVGVYIIVSVLVIPAMVTMGLNTLASHLFAFYFGILCNITPPVATAAYGAAGIAGTSPWSTGVKSFKLALPIFCIPYIFITQPALLMEGTIAEFMFVLLKAVSAVFVFDVAVVGYLFRKCVALERLLLFVAGVCIAWSGFFLPFGGIVFAGLIFLLLKISAKRENAPIIS